MADAPLASSYASDNLNYHTGMMVKQGGRIKTWKRRFFVLDKNNYTLRYYKNEHEALPKGVISLAGYIVSEAEAEIRKPFALKIEREGFRTYFMVADDFPSMELWLVHLKTSIDAAPPPVDVPAYANFDNDNENSDEEGDALANEKKSLWKQAKQNLAENLGQIQQMTSQISIARWFSSGTDDTGIVPAGKNASTNTLVADPQGSPPKHPQGDAHPPLSPRTPGPQQQRDVFAGLLPQSTYTKDPTSTLITSHEGKPLKKAGLLEADMLAHRQADTEAMSTLIPMPSSDELATLIPGTNCDNNLKFSRTPGMQIDVPKNIPYIRLLPRTPRIQLVESDLLQPVRLGRWNKEEPFPGPDPYQIQLDCKVVSRKHAEIWSVGGEFYIRDNKSQSGTFLNAMRLSLPGEESKPFKLKNNDLIQLGVDYMGGVEEGTKAVVFSCYLSFTKNIADTLSTSPQVQMVDLTMVQKNILRN